MSNLRNFTQKTCVPAMLIVWSATASLGQSLDYANAGSGNSRGSVAILDWSGSALGNGIQNGDAATFNLPGCRQGTLTATFSNVVGNGSSYTPADMRTWAGASTFNAYDGPGTGEALYGGDGDDISFTVTWSLSDPSGAPLDLVFFDAESTNPDPNPQPESLEVTTNGGAWQLIENAVGTNYAISGVGSSTIRITDTENPSHAPILYTTGVTTTDIVIDAGGRQAVAFGILAGCDYGDANGYAAAAHALQEAPGTVPDLEPASGSIFLGSTGPDSELSTQTAANGTGDDADGQGDDENGVVVPTLSAGNTADITIPSADITGSGAGTLHAWIDFDLNGTFDSDEYASTPFNNGATADLVFSGYGTTAAAGTTFARFRLTTQTLTAADAAGNAFNGEVEDFAVTIQAALPIAANDDTVSAPVDATTAQTGVVDIFADNGDGTDTLNGVATDETAVTVSVAPGSSLPTGFTLNADGTVDIAAGTAAGAYTFDYQICETLNPTNCETATISLTVGAGGIGVVKGSVFNDEVVADTNGQVGETITYTYTVSNEGNLDLDTVTLTETGFTGAGTTPTPALVAASDTGADGILSVGESWTYTATYTLIAADVAAGSVDNQATASGDTPGGTTVSDVSDSSNAGDGDGTGTPGPGATNDETTTTSFGTNPIVANDDTPPAIDGAVGGAVLNVVANDTLGGVANPTIGTGVTVNETGTAQDGTTSLGLNVAPVAGGITLDPATGLITVAAGTTAGTYVYTYEICETLNPTNCDTATATIVVDPTPIVANDDTPPAIEGVTGGTIPNVVANDTLGGVANPTIGTDVTVNESGTAQDGTTALGLNATPAAGGITLDPATGIITILPGTTGGVYNYTYEICEVLNPTNCDTASVIIGVMPFDLISRIKEDLEAILEENLVNTLTTQSNQISGYSADALDRLRQRSESQCLAAVNLQAKNILFDVNKAIIKPESQRILDEIAGILGSCPGSAFEISGHTDSDASGAYNLDLSQRRVDAVLRALSARDLDTTGYIARGYGESQPIASNSTAAGKARNRRVEFRALTDEENYHGPCEDSFSLVRTFDAQANDDGANADGYFVRDDHNCITDRREVFEGSLSFSDTGQGQTQSAINLSYRREQYRGSDSVFGYFVGLYASQSDVSSRANGEIRGRGVNAGIYGAQRLHKELFLDYYLGAAAGRHEFDLDFERDIGTITATGDYRYIAGFAGVALSGEMELGETTVTPRVGFDYIYTPGADVDVLAEIGALSEAGDLELDAISGGRIFAEIRTDRLIWDDTANFWLNPRISCYQSLGNLDSVCGFGGSIGIESTDEDSDLTYSLRLNGEWGRDHFFGSLSLRASRQIGHGRLSGEAGLNADGNVTMSANFDLQF